MGFEAFYVNTPRANDAAMIILGDPLVQLGETISNSPYDTGSLTAGQTEVHRQATCPGVCTADFSGTVNVFAHFLHMHNYGEKIYTEKYGVDGGALGVVGGRVDYWDNGYQQSLNIGYTIEPGETLQTHCWYNVGSQSSDITFGTPTSSEMCQDFVFYYPAQYRGVDANGNAERFAMCGLFKAGSEAYTLCGSLSQADNAYLITSGQEDKGTANKDDPLNFGTANLASLATADGDVCSFIATPSHPPPPISPSPLLPRPATPPSPALPPSPAFPPGAETRVVYKTKVEVRP